MHTESKVQFSALPPELYWYQMSVNSWPVRATRYVHSHWCKRQEQLLNFQWFLLAHSSSRGLVPGPGSLQTAAPLLSLSTVTPNLVSPANLMRVHCVPWHPQDHQISILFLHICSCSLSGVVKRYKISTKKGHFGLLFCPQLNNCHQQLTVPSKMLRFSTPTVNNC